MKYYCNPINIPYRNQFVKKKEKVRIIREAGDPSLVLFKGKYYLFLSVQGGFFTSEDLIQWEFYKYPQNVAVYDYAPDVAVVGNYLYVCASRVFKNCPFYRTEDPVHGTFEEIEGTFPFKDPKLFQDDDERIYLYWGCSNQTPIYGVELDQSTMHPLGERVPLIYENTKENGYERCGDDHAMCVPMEAVEEFLVTSLEHDPATTTEEEKEKLRYLMSSSPYVEGAWMTKYQDTYYLQYAVPGTENNVYCDGVYTSKSPLGPFVRAKNNPYSYKPGGFITGAGHGSTCEDMEGRLWHIATMRISVNYAFERRLGLWRAGFDEDGELYCDQRYGDWPVRIDQKPWEKPDWMLLSYGKPVTASSGEGMQKVTDEDIRTWWKAGSTHTGEWVMVDLEEICDVHAIQVNFADDENYGELPEGVSFHEDSGGKYVDMENYYTRWTLEGSADGENFFVLEDKSEADTDLTHELVVCEDGLNIRYIRLKICEIPYDHVPCISGLRVFGKKDGSAPAQAKGVQVQRTGDLDMIVSWEADDAVGHNVLWGYAPDKLYHNYMVFGKNEQKIGAFMKDQPVYVRVDAFNACGITEGIVIG